jgi:hypothetical protein
MRIQSNVINRVATIQVFTGWDSFLTRLMGSSFPIAPSGTTVDILSVEIPEGSHAVAFFSKTEGPQQVGYGLNSEVSHVVKKSTGVLLCWEDTNGKTIAKGNSEMSASEMARFNPFVCSDTDVFVTDVTSKTIYTSGLSRKKATNPAWTYKTVSMDSILEYVVKRITIEELDERATSEEHSRNQLATLQQQNGDLLEEKAIADYNILALRDELQSMSKEIDRLRSHLKTADTIMIHDSGKMMKVEMIMGKLMKGWPWVNARRLGKELRSITDEKLPKTQ